MRCRQLRKHSRAGALAGVRSPFTLWKHVHSKPYSLSPAAADLVLVRRRYAYRTNEPL